MGLANVLKNMSEKRHEKSQRFKELETEHRLQKMLEERQKSSNQRELERHFKEEEEKRIKLALDKIRKKRQKTSWKDNSILKKGKNIAKDDRLMLKEKNIFENEKKLFMGKEGLHFLKKNEGFF